MICGSVSIFSMKFAGNSGNLNNFSIKFDDNPKDYYDLEFCKALIYFNSERLKDKIKAQNILEQMLEYPKLHFEVKIDALLLLMEILLLEIQVNNNDAVLKEIFDIIDDLEYLSKDQNLPTLQIDTLVMNSKLKLFQKNYKKANLLLNEALDISKLKNMEYPIKKIELELEKINNKSLNESMKNEGSRKINQIGINELIEYVQDVRRLQIVNKQENSI